MEENSLKGTVLLWLENGLEEGVGSPCSGLRHFPGMLPSSLIPEPFQTRCGWRALSWKVLFLLSHSSPPSPPVPAAPSKALSSSPIYFHFRLMTVKSLIRKWDYPECSALMELILPLSGAQIFKGISVHSPLPRSWLWRSQKSCDLTPGRLLFQSPLQSHPAFSSHVEMPQSKPPGQREVMLL